MVNYRDLPGAMWTKIMPHFGLAYGEPERDIMMRATRYDAKAPRFEFADDYEAKQRQASVLIRTQAERHLGGVYRQLEILRNGDPPNLDA